MTTPTLHDDRIDKMRLSVMHRVDADIRRRGHRIRTTIGVTAASVLVVGFGGYVVNAGGAGSNDSMSAGVSQDSVAEGPAAAQDRSESGGGGGGNKAAPDDDRQVITTGSISVTVTKPRQSVQQLSTWIESIGGRIDDRFENGSGDEASATVTVRVPSRRVSATIERLGTYGTVDDVSLENSDVTAQAKDLDARIDALDLSIDRLEDILTRAGSSAEVIKAEEALTQRQEQLESLQAQRNGLADQVSLSTLTIGFSQTDQVDSVEPGGFGGGLRDGWNALVSTLNTVVEVAGRVLPWAALAVVLLVAGRLVGRLRPQRRSR